MRKRTFNITRNPRTRLDAKYKSSKRWIDDGNSVMYYARPQNKTYVNMISKYKKVKRGL